jgi:prepilin-type N-terminal cleavage/methylation domain-containing protein
MMKRPIYKIQKGCLDYGFTITELMIATAVFAVILVVAQTMFVQIGHLFYRGISITSTQETADHIFQDINGNFQTAPGVNFGNLGGYEYYCIGNTRYTYKINNEIDTSATPNYASDSSGNYGILKDVVPGAGQGCSTPCDSTSGSPCPVNTYKLSNPVELLGDKMRVEQFDICQSTSNSTLYNVTIVLAYGDDDSLVYTSASPPSTANCIPATPPDSNYYGSVGCQNDVRNSFCAISRVDTSVYQGFHQ